MSTPDLSDDDRRVLEMFRRRARPLSVKVRDVLRHDPLALPRKAGATFGGGGCTDADRTSERTHVGPTGRTPRRLM